MMGYTIGYTVGRLVGRLLCRIGVHAVPPGQRSAADFIERPRTFRCVRCGKAEQG